jgi:hypothetical protein
MNVGTKRERIYYIILNTSISISVHWRATEVILFFWQDDCEHGFSQRSHFPAGQFQLLFDFPHCAYPYENVCSFVVGLVE